MLNEEQKTNVEIVSGGIGLAAFIGFLMGMTVPTIVFVVFYFGIGSMVVLVPVVLALCMIFVWRIQVWVLNDIGSI